MELGETLLWAKRIRIENVALNKKVDNQERTIQFLQSQAEKQDSEFTTMRKQLHTNTKLVEKLNTALTQQHQRDLDRKTELDQLVQTNEKAIAEIDTSVKSLAKYVQDIETTIDRDVMQVMPMLQSKQMKQSEDITSLVDNIKEVQKAQTEHTRELWAHENRLTNMDADRDVMQRNLVVFARCCKQVDADMPKATGDATSALDLAQAVKRMVIEQGKQLDSLRNDPARAHEKSTTAAKLSKLKKEPTVTPPSDRARIVDSQATTQWDDSVPRPSFSQELNSSPFPITPRPARIVREKARALPVPNFQLLSQSTGRPKTADVSKSHPMMLRKNTDHSEQMSSLPVTMSSQAESSGYTQLSDVHQQPRRTTGTTPPPIIILDSIEPASSDVAPAHSDARSANTSAKRHADPVVDSTQPSKSPIATSPPKKKYKPNRKISLDGW